LGSANQGNVLKSLIIQRLKLDRSFDLLPEIDTKFPAILKGLLLYTTSICNEREIRGFFTEFLEKIPLKSLKLSQSQLDLFFRAIFECSDGLFSQHPQRKQALAAWQRFLTGIQGCAWIILSAQSRQIKM